MANCCDKHTREIGPGGPALRQMLFSSGGSHLSNIRVSHPGSKDMSDNVLYRDIKPGQTKLPLPQQYTSYCNPSMHGRVITTCCIYTNNYIAKLRKCKLGILEFISTAIVTCMAFLRALHSKSRLMAP